MPTTALRIVLVDDHRFVRNGLRTMLEQGGLDVVGEAGTGREGVRVAAEARPDVVMLDIGLPDVSGLDLIPAMRERVPGAAVVMMTASASPADIVRALSAGATAYLLKDAPLEEVLATVRAAGRGEPLLSPRVARSLVEHLRAPAAAPEDGGAAGPELSERERDILRLVGDGLSNSEIARELALSVGSVKADLSDALVKLGAHNRVHAAVQAVRLGLIG